MSDYHDEMRRLSEQIAELEPELGRVAGEVAELQSVLAPFMQQFRRDVLQYYDQLVAVEREIADLRVMRGELKARDAKYTQSPLHRFSEDNPSVQEQYERVWQGKEVPKFKGPELSPASEKVQRFYATVVANVHPGLTEDPQERAKRAKDMKRADEAYIKRNEIALRGMAEMYRQRSNLPAIVDQRVVNELRDKFYMMEELVAQLEGQAFELRYGDVAKVKAHADAALKNGHNLLLEMGAEIQDKYYQAQSTLSALK